MKAISKYAVLVFVLAIAINIHPLKGQQLPVEVHYLGHAAFVMDFNDFTAVTDLGTSYCWGLNSPIYGIGDHIPTIMSFSHYHPDHYDPERIPDNVPYIIDLLDTLNIMNLWVYPVRTCETTPGVESNTSFIYDYNGFRICHLGDAQAEIMNIADPEQQAIILEKFPEQIDLLLMTIEGVDQFIPQAEMFIDLLQPGMVIPMHYWSPEYKEEFLSYLELQNDTAGKNYQVNRLSGPSLSIDPADTIHNAIKVFGLAPAPYETIGIENEYARDDLEEELEYSVYPIPAEETFYVKCNASKQSTISWDIINMQGKYLSSGQIFNIKPGCNIIQLKTGHIPTGCYLLVFKNDCHIQIKKLIIK